MKRVAYRTGSCQGHGAENVASDWKREERPGCFEEVRNMNYVNTFKKVLLAAGWSFPLQYLRNDARSRGMALIS